MGGLKALGQLRATGQINMEVFCFEIKNPIILLELIVMMSERLLDKEF